MAEYDLTQRIAPMLDRHLVFPLLEFLQERQLHADEQILKSKIELLNKTNMVDYAMDIHKSLYHTEDVPQDMLDRRAEVVARLKSLEEAAAPLVSFLQNASAVQELRADKQYNLQMLNERYQIGPDQIEALYQYAKFQFECGNYSGAADYLYQYRALCTNSERSLSALWGKLAAEILMQNWDIALEELNRLKEKIDSKNFASPLSQMQSRIWLMHWSLFIFFNNDNGRSQIIDLFNQDKYLNAIQTSAPHLLRYLATAFIVNKRRRPQFKDFLKVIQQEQHSYKDPITEFLACVYVNYDFDGAQKKMRECEEVILNDPFLGKRVEEGNFSTVPLRDEFLENARLFIFETYCRIHQRIDMGVLAEKLNLNYEEAERWIVNVSESGSAVPQSADPASRPEENAETTTPSAASIPVPDNIGPSVSPANIRAGDTAVQEDTPRPSFPFTAVGRDNAAPAEVPNPSSIPAADLGGSQEGPSVGPAVQGEGSATVSLSDFSPAEFLNHFINNDIYFGEGWGKVKGKNCNNKMEFFFNCHSLMMSEMASAYRRANAASSDSRRLQKIISRSEAEKHSAEESHAQHIAQMQELADGYLAVQLAAEEKLLAAEEQIKQLKGQLADSQDALVAHMEGESLANEAKEKAERVSEDLQHQLATQDLLMKDLKAVWEVEAVDRFKRSPAYDALLFREFERGMRQRRDFSH